MRRLCSYLGLRFFLALVLGIIWTPATFAKTTLIDDAGTQSLEPAVSLRWKSLEPSRRAADNLLIGNTTIRVHLNVLPWLHRQGRIYLTLPAQAPGPIGAVWNTRGTFRAGQLRSGNRVLLYAGPISAPFLEDVFTLQFSIDAALVRRAFPVNLRFEMDED